MSELGIYCRHLIDKRVTPSLTLLLAKGSDVLLNRAFEVDPMTGQTLEIAPDRIYDLASLTKPALTALCLAMLCADDLMSPKQTLTDFFPNAHADLCLHHLAAHCAGLVDWYPFYLFPEPFDEQIKAHLRSAGPVHHVVYSCLGYMILKRIFERVIAPESPIDWCQRRIFRPLKLKDTAFGGDATLLNSARVMPSEIGHAYEQKLAQKRGFVAQSQAYDWQRVAAPGETHDLNARWLGGMGGNAGLFSTAIELLALLNQCDAKTTQLLAGNQDLCDLFWKNLTPWSPAHRTFGFKRNSSLSAAAGRALSRRAIGHHGFTGCSAWMEPQGGLRLIVLTNRIHPRVDETVNFNRIRRRLFRLMVKDIGL